MTTINIKTNGHRKKLICDAANIIGTSAPNFTLRAAVERAYGVIRKKNVEKNAEIEGYIETYRISSLIENAVEEGVSIALERQHEKTNISKNIKEQVTIKFFHLINEAVEKGIKNKCENKQLLDEDDIEEIIGSILYELSKIINPEHLSLRVICDACNKSTVNYE